MINPTTPKKNKKYTFEPDRNSQGPLPEIGSPYFSPWKALRQKLDSSESAAAQSYPDTEWRIDGLKSDKVERTENRPLSIIRIPSGRNSSLLELILRLEGMKPVLIQECVADNSWKLLVAVTLLNKTAGRLAIPTFWKIMAKWPTPVELSQSDEGELISIIRHLGTQNIRAKRLVAISRSYIQEPPSTYDIRHSDRTSTPPRRRSRFFASPSAPKQYPATPISHLPGIGPYALDSYRIFSTIHDYPGSEEWKTVSPTDKELIRYLKWKWAFTEGLEWSPTKGVIRNVTEKYLSALIVELGNTNALPLEPANNKDWRKDGKQS